MTDAPLPPPPQYEAERSPRPRWLGAVAILSVVAILGATVGWAVLAADPTPTVAELGTVEDGLDDLLAYVEEARGLDFKERPVVEALAPAEYEARVREGFVEDLDEERESVEDATDFYAALGLVDPDIDMVEVLEDYFSGATLGVYDSETGELLVRGDRLTPGLQVTIVHELVHALDDQWFGLDRPGLDDRDDEAGFAFSALSEGDATRIHEEFVGAMAPETLQDYLAEQAATLPDFDPSALPSVLLLEDRLLYVSGAEFAGAVAQAGGNAEVDAAFEEPPTTTEEILEPDVFLGGQALVEVPDPEADGAVVERGVAGQFLLGLLTDAPDGSGPEWSGDRYVQWTDGEVRCVRIRFADPDASLPDALDAWVDGGDDRTVAAEAGTTLLTGCR
jgi:hypothetical protein